MKKIIKLTESDLEMIVKKVLKEQSVINEIASDAEDLDGSQEAVNTEISNFNQVAPRSQKQNMIAIQQKLKSLGYDLGTYGPNKDGVDGNYGRRTLAAIKSFQTKNGVKSTGWVGTVTAPLLGVDPMNSNVSSSGRKTPSKSSVQQTKVDPKTKKPIVKTNDKLQTGVTKDSLLSPSIDVGFKDKFNIAKLSDKDSTYVCKAGQTECGQFVNDFSKKLSYVGNAWLAHDLDQVGRRVMSSYTSLSPQQVEKIFSIFKQIEKQGGPQERKSGGQVENIKSLQQNLIKDVSPSSLKVDDVVGIYYPSSSHHEEAFHQAGKPYFVSDGKGGWKKGNTITGGKGFGMNTHVGIVGGVKNGVPLIFHNISGDVYSDPYNKLRGGGKITWIKR
jgi:peptidoglycan hydrolase-like protein with peptidoglycan-binding domain